MAAHPIARDSHYVPQAILRRWSRDGTHVYAYRMLVSRSNVPDWKLRPIRGLAFQRDLYTTFSGGAELDDFEQWIAREFEDAGLRSIDKLVNRQRLTPTDWRSLARLVAAQDLRTPLNLIDSLDRWSRVMPQILDDTLRTTMAELERAKAAGLELTAGDVTSPLAEALRVRFQPSADEPGKVQLRAEVVVGRRLWIASMRHTLGSAAQALCVHRWSVAEPYGNDEWPLTDHPVLRLNYESPCRYDFRGGWANPGSEIMMPVSPRYLLYVQVGKKRANRFTFPPEETRLVQRLIVERAHRWVFATLPHSWVSQIRPRIVNAEQFRAEEAEWKSWHANQLAAERRD